MNLTFGVTTDYKNIVQLNQVLNSIRDLNIPEYEILVIGSKDYSHYQDTTFLYFNEEQKPGWVTRKKNILVEQALYENVVLLHDYFVFDKNWYNSFLSFGNEWDICSCQQQLITGKRHFTDWVTWDDPIYPRWSALPYHEWSRTQYMYMSGGFMMVKKHVVMDNPFNEELMHGQAEDVEWSLRVRDKYIMKCNGDAIVKHNKVHRDAR